MTATTAERRRTTFAPVYIRVSSVAMWCFCFLIYLALVNGQWSLLHAMLEKQNSIGQVGYVTLCSRYERWPYSLRSLFHHTPSHLYQYGDQMTGLKALVVDVYGLSQRMDISSCFGYRQVEVGG